MNRQLQPKGITAKVAMNDSCLQIMLESAQVPDQQTLVAWVRKSIMGLGANSIEEIRVYGRQTGEEFPAWTQEFELAGQQLPSPNLKVTQSVTIREAPTSVPQIKPYKSKSSLPIQNPNSTAKNKTTSKEFASNKQLLTRISRTFLALSIVLFFLNWAWALISFVIFYYFATKVSDLEEAAAKKIRQEQQRLKQEEKQKKYLTLLDSVNSPVKELQTNLVQTILEEFRKVEARVNVGVSYIDFPAVLAPAKYAVQQFERSKDYHVSPALSELIVEIMSYYEFSHVCINKKVHRFTDSFTIGLEKPGIPTSDILGKQIKQEFPELQEHYGYYPFDMVIQTIWAKALECTNKLQQILDVAQQ